MAPPKGKEGLAFCPTEGDEWNVQVHEMDILSIPKRTDDKDLDIRKTLCTLFGFALLILIGCHGYSQSPTPGSSPVLEIAAPPVLCLGDTPSFGINTNLLIEKLIGWDFGDAASGSNNTSTLGTPSHTYGDTGTYTVTCIVQVNCGGPTNINNPIGVPCFYIDTLFTTITVLDCDTTDGCQLYIPNAFTPNSDGRNDGFRTFTSCGLDAYELVVMNRWGERVFITTDPEEQWNGKHKGLACPIGVYAYLVTYTFTNEKKKTKYGLITLIP